VLVLAAFHVRCNYRPRVQRDLGLSSHASIQAATLYFTDLATTPDIQPPGRWLLTIRSLSSYDGDLTELESHQLPYAQYSTTAFLGAHLAVL